MIASKCDPLENLKWEHDSGIYSIQFSDGKAIVTEQDINSAERYVPTILGQHEEVLCDFGHALSFENAEAYIRANLIEIDQPDDNETKFTAKLLDALDKCIEVLSSENRKYHRMRLQNIIRFLKNERTIHHASDYDWYTHTFDWEYTDNIYHIKTPHGIAIIEEKVTTNQSRFLVDGSTQYYTLQLEDETGVVLNSYFVPPTDFAEAEHRMRELLKECEYTSVAEESLDQITFSLAICKCLLPSDTDFMVFVRLRYLDYRLSERLL